ncbi:ABC transporter ATP-binding protein [Sporosarcina sp. BI001-red]|uniref:ABC transporter ATP-binding protein n=1 Tax=Sporosarcina sp. BI001-red TaxID=2282866 RepID=UPI001314C2E2|nr:ABC transporter ATP-binding protein [Sporosarcina sp. BI001-red]
MSVLTVHQLTKKYGKRSVLKEISFTMEKGDVIGLVGPNGAGKSTLMRSILSLERVEQGSVTVEGVSNQNPEFFQYVSFLPSDNYLYQQLTGYDHLAFVASIYKLERQIIDSVVDSIGVRSYVDQPVKSYSYGMRQHLLIALSILTNPRVILMDEPFNGLDPTSVIELKQLIRSLRDRGISILVSTHNLDILEDLTKTIWFLKDGELVKTSMEHSEETPFYIEFSMPDGRSAAQLLANSNSPLPFREAEDGLVTDPAYPLEAYLGKLLESGAKVLGVRRSNGNLEQLYKEFYEIDSTV